MGHKAWQNHPWSPEFPLARLSKVCTDTANPHGKSMRDLQAWLPLINVLQWPHVVYYDDTSQVDALLNSSDSADISKQILTYTARYAAAISDEVTPAIGRMLSRPQVSKAST